MADLYAEQDRGSDEAYRRYLAGMDQSMRQKVAMTAAHFLGEGTVADMGMGSGAGSHALATLYPRMRVVGVDVNPEMVERAQQAYAAGNLSFVTGDIAQPVFPAGFLDGIFDSSVLHHVSSFNGYDRDAVARALAHQVAQLRDGGSLIVRDFVAPPGGDVLLDLPDDDGDGSTDPRCCSSARLLERFAREFRPLSSEPGFHLRRIPADEAPGLGIGWQRFRLDHRHAAEFLLRKDYRADWESEVLEEYAYFTQPDFETEFARLGLRLLASSPIRNSWIVEHRFVGRAALRDLAGRLLEFPPTNYLVAGEKVPATRGVTFEAGGSTSPTGFLVLHCFEHRASGQLRDLVRRPGTTVDVIPWFQQGGALFVIARRGHPRPVLRAPEAGAGLDGSSPVGYVTEPILAILSDKPVGLTVEEALVEAASIVPEDIQSLREAGTYYPSPGGIVEEVRAVHVEVAPRFVAQALRNATGFSTSGLVRAIDARQLLRAAQVGALPDARLELNVYELLAARNESFGPWIGAEIQLTDDEGIPGVSLDACVPRPERAYRVAQPGSSAGFLRLCSREFTERNAQGDALFAQPRDYVVPSRLSTHTIACALLRRHAGTVLIGLDEDDLPAAQCFTGNSAIWVTPAWRIPPEFRELQPAIAWVRSQLEQTYGVVVMRTTELGGRYHPSAGVTPEVVYPLAVVVSARNPVRRPLHWVPLAEVVRRIRRVQDGHLRILALRAAHALWSRPPPHVRSGGVPDSTTSRLLP
jgi:SAM-dependent methyltransferase